MQKCERPQDEPVHAYGVELSYVHAEQRFTFFNREVVSFGKFRGGLEVSVTARRLSVHIAKQFLQGVCAHVPQQYKSGLE